MPFVKTELPGVLIFEPKVFGDDRGYFFESYNENAFRAEGLDIRWVQDNQSRSAYGTVRGLHYQVAPYAQAKLVRVLSGRVRDIVVDIRKGSPAYGKWIAVDLSAENKRQLLVPKGFAHGFSVLSPEGAEFFYKCDAFYNPEKESGIIFSDPALGADWGVPAREIRISEKDGRLPVLEKAVNNFVYGVNS